MENAPAANEGREKLAEGRRRPIPAKRRLQRQGPSSPRAASADLKLPIYVLSAATSLRTIAASQRRGASWPLSRAVGMAESYAVRDELIRTRRRTAAIGRELP